MHARFHSGRCFFSQAQTLERLVTTLNVNGRDMQVDADPSTPILWALRDHLNMTGTKFGCGAAMCGACTVHLNGESVKSCTVLAAQADGAEVTTIEGLARDGALHPLQDAFWEKHGLQCGFCTPGMIMAAADLLARNPSPTDEEIRHGLEGNLCRCTGYHNIVEAVKVAAGKGVPA
jgi:aerobic carbon-monoxide dehydrogenase small subunit